MYNTYIYTPTHRVYIYILHYNILYGLFTRVCAMLTRQRKVAQQHNTTSSMTATDNS